jgi:hypothetical protein
LTEVPGGWSPIRKLHHTVETNSLFPVPYSLSFHPNGVAATVTGCATIADRTSSAGHT